MKSNTKARQRSAAASPSGKSNTKIGRPPASELLGEPTITIAGIEGQSLKRDLQGRLYLCHWDRDGWDIHRVGYTDALQWLGQLKTSRRPEDLLALHGIHDPSEVPGRAGEEGEEWRGEFDRLDPALAQVILEGARQRNLPAEEFLRRAIESAPPLAPPEIPDHPLSTVAREASDLQDCIYEARGMVDALNSITLLCVAHAPQKKDALLPFTENQEFGLGLLHNHVMDRLTSADNAATELTRRLNALGLRAASIASSRAGQGKAVAHV